MNCDLQIIVMLEKFGLITEEQANRAEEESQREWAKAFDTQEWWWKLGQIANAQYVPWWKRWWDGSTWWILDWVREKRGW